MLVRKKKTSVFALAAVAAAMTLTACGGNGTDGTPSSAQPASSSSAKVGGQPPAATPEPGRSGSPKAQESSKKAGAKCTDQINYADDPRSNAEINSIGESTGRCPAPEKAPKPQKPQKPAGTPKKAGVSCTNQINYAGDPRSNAEINSIGEDTGYCPPVKH
ncbi:hypothetical protein ACIO3O_14030 [Streptomyces sp. NPDC087440]|uniref:hypothetical protein n=1 Tax=Streptomyces sp. NPDC087440 TaxID=3365790 RepID=UPI0038092A10